MCGSASASTRSPRSRAVCRRDRADRDDERLRVRERRRRASQKFVDGRRRRERDRVDRAGAHAREVVGIGRGRDGAVHREHLDVVALRGEALGQHVARDLGAREQHPFAGVPGRGTRRAATRRRTARARDRRARRGGASASAVPGPIAATRTGASARASSPARCEPAVEERVDAVGRREHEPRVLREVGQRRSRPARCAIAGSSTHLGAERSSRAAQLARLLARAGHDDACARTAAAARTTRSRARRRRRRRSRSGASTPDVGDRRRASPRTVRCSGRVPQRTAATGVSASRPPAISAFGDLGDAARAHEHHERAAGARERVPVGVGRALRRVLVAGHDRDARRHAAVRHRDAGVRGRGDRARDAGHDLERHARGDARLGLFAAAAEHERVAALQPHDRRSPARPRSTSSALICVLRHRDVARAPCRRRRARRRAARARAARPARAGRRRRRRRARSSSSPRRVSRPGSPGPAPTR